MNAILPHVQYVAGNQVGQVHYCIVSATWIVCLIAQSVEQQLQESQTQITALTKENKELKTKFEEAQKATAKATVATELAKQLSESKLPEVSQARIRKQFAEAEKADGIKEAITEEVEYLKKVGATRVTHRAEVAPLFGNREAWGSPFPKRHRLTATIHRGTKKAAPAHCVWPARIRIPGVVS